MLLFTLLRKIIAFSILVFLITLAFVISFATLQPFFEPKTPRADLIVVLGGGMSADGTLHSSTTLRVDRGIALFLAGAAPRIHFTGGRHTPNGPAAGDQMAKRAILAGVPKSAITTENASHSTLQNALFSQENTTPAKTILLITEGFHLPRSWISLKLFGAQKITLIHARRFRGGFADSTRMVLRESLAIWFNAARFLIWQAAHMIDMPQSDRDRLLT